VRDQQRQFSHVERGGWVVSQPVECSVEVHNGDYRPRRQKG
jgi:hypothetical protein